MRATRLEQESVAEIMDSILSELRVSGEDRLRLLTSWTEGRAELNTSRAPLNELYAVLENLRDELGRLMAERSALIDGHRYLHAELQRRTEESELAQAVFMRRQVS